MNPMQKVVFGTEFALNNEGVTCIIIFIISAQNENNLEDFFMPNEMDYEVEKELEFIKESIKRINRPSDSLYKKTYDDENIWIFLPLGGHKEEK